MSFVTVAELRTLLERADPNQIVSLRVKQKLLHITGFITRDNDGFLVNVFVDEKGRVTLVGGEST